MDNWDAIEDAELEINNSLIDYEMAGNCAERFNTGKPQLTFNVLGAEVQKIEAEVWAFGAEKYAAGNWLKGCSVMKSADSLQRHLTAYLNGEDLDKETQLSTLGHIICSAKILAQGHIMGFDDRPEEVKSNEKKGL